MSRFSRTRPRSIPKETDAYTVDEFAARHRISKQFYYKLRAQGLGPDVMKLGARVLISKEAASAWREMMEKRGQEQAVEPKPAA